MTVTADRVEPRPQIRFAGPKAGDPRLKVAFVTISAQVLGQVSLDFNVSVAQIFVAVGVCMVIEVGIDLLKRAPVIQWPGSAMLTGNGIALIARVPGTEHGQWWSMRGWWVFAGMALIAMGSKHLFRVDGRPLFNPSNLALVVGFLLIPEAWADPQDLWWGPLTVGLVLTYLVITIGGIAVVHLLRLWSIVVPFVLIYGISMAVLAGSDHCMTARWSIDPVCGEQFWKTLVLSPEILIFMLFMITDPRPAPRNKAPRVAFGVLVGLTSSLLVAFQSTEYATKVAVLAGLTVVYVTRPLLENRVEGVLASPRWRPATVGTGVLVLAVLFAPLLAWAGSRSSYAPTADGADFAAREIVQIDPASLPRVQLEDDVRRVAAGLEGDTAQAMLLDLAVDLELAAIALERQDPDLAAAAGVGSWLDSVSAEISAARSGEMVLVRRYRFNEAELIVVGDRVTPQSLPPLGIQVTGTEQKGGSEPEAFTGTFTLTKVDGHFLVSADDRSGAIDLAEIEAESVPMSTFEKAIRLGTDVDEGSVAGQLPLFEDVTRSAGIEMDTTAAHLDEIPVPSADVAAAMVDTVPVWTALMNSQTYFGTGQAWGDVDGDGWPDLYLTNQVGPNALLINQRDGTFQPASDRLAAEVRLADDVSGGATWVDYDNDGRSDLHVLSADGGRLFHNEGGQALVDVTSEAGIRGSGKGMTASWADFDGDGDLDSYIANYGCQPCRPNNAPPVSEDQRDPDLLFENLGDGTFVDRSAWIDHMPGTRGLGFAATWIDYDHDGRPDLYLLNDVRDDQGTADTAAGRIDGDGSTPGNVMIHNDGPGCDGWCFSDTTEASGTQRRANAMGIAADDFDGDGLADLFFTNGGFSAGPAGLLRDRGDSTFEETGPQRNANLGEWAWGASPLDVDNDGRRDVLVSVGYSDALQQLPNEQLTEEFLADAERQRRRALSEGTAKTPWGYVDPPWDVAEDPHRRTDQNRVLLQQLDGTFDVVTVGDGTGLSRVHYGNATADYDGDGWVDAVIGNLGDGYSLLRNRAEVGAAHHRAVIDLEGDGQRVNTDAVGAEVRITDSSGRRQSGWVRIGGSLGSGNDTTLHFGLGDHSVDRLEVIWPDGTTWSSAEEPTDHRITVRYGSGSTARPLGEPE